MFIWKAYKTRVAIKSIIERNFTNAKRKKRRNHSLLIHKGPVISLSVYVVVLIEDLRQTAKPDLVHLNVAVSVHDR